MNVANAPIPTTPTAACSCAARTRARSTYGTGAIVKVAAVAQPMPKAGGKWNTYEITMQGPRLVVVLNGQKTIDVQDSKFASGPFALQWGRGTIKFRKVEIKPI